MLKQFIRKGVRCTRRKFWEAMDFVYDMRICGTSLVKYVPSIFRDNEVGIGGTGTQSTNYGMLKEMFSHVQLSPSDRFLDVGCGKGRVLAFLVKQKCPCDIHGIEHNPEVGRIAAEWAKRYKQVTVMIGDAFQIDYNNYTVLGLGRSFLPKTFLAFVEYLEKNLTHPITLIYWWDNESGHLLLDRPGWELRIRDKIRKIHGIRLTDHPQPYSIWIYDPRKKSDCAQ